MMWDSIHRDLSHIDVIYIYLPEYGIYNTALFVKSVCKADNENWVIYENQPSKTAPPVRLYALSSSSSAGCFQPLTVQTLNIRMPIPHIAPVCHLYSHASALQARAVDVSGDAGPYRWVSRRL